MALAFAERGALRVAHLTEALEMVRACAVGRFDETVEASVSLNVDAKQSHERVRGRVLLPHGTGKMQRVAVFARVELADAARAAGADVVGAEDDLIAEVAQGKVNFDRCLATPDVLPALAKVARVLGPKGLMPAPKRGTVVYNADDFALAVQRLRGGEVEFKAQSEGVVNGGVGKISFGPERLSENIIAFLCAHHPDHRAPPPSAHGAHVPRAQGWRADGPPGALPRQAAAQDHADVDARPVD